MIISHKHKYIFFKPMKVAGTSVEAALSLSLGHEDIFTGTNVKKELALEGYDLKPVNNWSTGRMLEGSEALEYLKLHCMEHLWNQGHQRLQVMDPIYDPHTTPEELSLSGFDYSSYKTLSIVRNPYDTLVSFFWWALNPPETLFEGANARQRKNSKKIEIFKPLKSDSINEIRQKIELFFALPGDYSYLGMEYNGEMTVLEWFINRQSAFYSTNVQKILRYENIQEEYDTLCHDIGINTSLLPRLKTSQRKKSLSYRDYYSETFLKTVTDKLGTAFEQFKYSF